MRGNMVGCKILQIDAEKFTTCLGKTRLPFCARDIRHLLSKQVAFGSKRSASWSWIWILTRRLESYLSKSLHRINKGFSNEADLLVEFRFQVPVRNHLLKWELVFWKNVRHHECRATICDSCPLSTIFPAYMQGFSWIYASNYLYIWSHSILKSCHLWMWNKVARG